MLKQAHKAQEMATWGSAAGELVGARFVAAKNHDGDGDKGGSSSSSSSSSREKDASSHPEHAPVHVVLERVGIALAHLIKFLAQNYEN